MTWHRWKDESGTHYFVASRWFRLEFTWQRGAW
jgi:hypothetical protein